MRRLLDRLGAPVLAIAGNHDIPLLDLLVACVSTTRRWRHKNGAVSARQVERVTALLAMAGREQLRLVVVHQPAAALRRWAEAGADLVLGRHIHLPYVMPIAGLARPVWVVQAGTAVSSRVRAGIPNSVNLIRCGAAATDGRCVIEQWDHMAEGRVFKCVKITQLEPARLLNWRVSKLPGRCASPLDDSRPDAAGPCSAAGSRKIHGGSAGHVVACFASNQWRIGLALRKSVLGNRRHKALRREGRLVRIGK